jgi:demethylsterigmatocystin 6-O-methyltransferase
VNPEDSTKCALQRAWNTALPGFTWVATHPQKAAYFTQFMTAQREGTSTWLDEYPVEKQAEGREAAKQPLFVDMGGGAGHQSIALRERFPRIPGRVIVQDLPYAIEMVSSPREGVEYMVHDFFQPQTVKGTYHFLVPYNRLMVSSSFPLFAPSANTDQCRVPILLHAEHPP